jgi:hypothetical protein
MTVIPFRKPAPTEAPTTPRRRRDKSFLLVPSRIRNAVVRLEQSLDAVAAGQAPWVDYNAIYEIIAILDFSAEYKQ